MLTSIFTATESFRQVENPAGTASLRDTRFPLVSMAGPVRQSGVALGISYSNYTSRDFTSATADTIDLRGVPVGVSDSFSSRGGLSDLRLAGSYRIRDRWVVGAGFHVITGTNRLESQRAFSDSAFLPTSQIAEISYAGVGISAGLVREFGPRFGIALLARSDGHVNVDRDSARIGTIDLPYTFGLGLRWRPVPQLDLGGQTIVRTWSGANSDLLQQGGTGAANTYEVAAGAEYVSDPKRPFRRPIRLGARYATLPFPLVPGEQGHEFGISAGSGMRFAQSRAGIDLAVQHVWRSEGPYSERAFIVSLGISGSAMSSRTAARAVGLKIFSPPAFPLARPPRYNCPMLKSVYIETYGCQMNVADSELMFGVLGREGYVRADEPAGADVMLVNTCAVRDNAEQRVIGRMGELQRHKRAGAVLGVVGCMAQRLGPALLAQVPKVDLVVGPDAYRSLPEIIAMAHAGQRVSDTEFRSWEHYEDVPAVREKGPTAFVTVQRGCDYRCTFCIVPYTRGPERSRRLEDVVPKSRRWWSRAPPKSPLLGQTVNSYHDGRHDFADLLEAVGRVDGIRRLRFTSPYPTDFTPRVVEAMARTPAVCEHVHLPVQSGSNAVLRRMLRRYTRERYLEVVRVLRDAMPGITFSTDIIVGFPGETDAQFEETLALVTEADFDDAYTFKYSVREGTPAVRLPDHVPDHAASERLERLIETVRANARRKNASRVGEIHEVLVERPARRGGLMLGRTRGNHLVLLDLPADSAGEYHSVRLTGTTGSTFTGAVAASSLAVL